MTNSDSTNIDDAGIDFTLDSQVRRYDWDDDETLRLRLLESIEELTGQEMTEIDPLYETLDIESLEELLEKTRTDDLSVVFSYEGCEFEVRCDGTLFACPSIGRSRA